MDYTQWFEREFEGLSRSYGLLCTPGAEIEARLSRLRSGMAKMGMDGILFYEKMDRFYFSGTTQDTLLFVPLEEKPLLMVRREEARARLESPLENIVGMYLVTTNLPEQWCAAQSPFCSMRSKNITHAQSCFKTCRHGR